LRPPIAAPGPRPLSQAPAASVPGGLDRSQRSGAGDLQ